MTAGNGKRARATAPLAAAGLGSASGWPGLLAGVLLGALGMALWSGSGPFAAPGSSSNAAPAVQLASLPSELGADAAAPGPAPAPAAALIRGSGAAVLRQRSDGHYWATATLNRSTAADMMVDTGASSVALTARTAKRLGLDPDALDYSVAVSTAGGEVWAAPVYLESLSVGRLRLEGVGALVLRDGLEQDLLGMNVLERVKSYEFNNGRRILILRD